MKRPPRTYDNLLMFFTMAGVQWEEACRLAREFADKPQSQPNRLADATVGGTA